MWRFMTCFMCRYNLQPLFLLGNRLQLQKPTIANKNWRPSSFPRTINHPFRKKRIYFAEMCSFEPKMKGLKCIGTDLEKAIFNGFSSQINSLKLLLCVRHLQINDKKKLGDLKASNSKEIMADIYGRQYDIIKEFGLADSKDPEDLAIRLKSLKKSGRIFVQGFMNGFVKKGNHNLKKA